MQYDEWDWVSIQCFYLPQVLEQCRYELVVPLTLLFSSTLLKVSSCHLESVEEEAQALQTLVLGYTIRYFYYTISYLTWSAVSSFFLQTPHVAPDCSVLQEAYLLFHSFLAWPEPCCSASKRLLYIIQQELRAPGSTQALIHCSETGRMSPHCFLSSVDSIVQGVIPHQGCLYPCTSAIIRQYMKKIVEKLN